MATKDDPTKKTLAKNVVSPKPEAVAVTPATEPTKPKNKGGRPRKQLSKTNFEALLKINPTMVEVCAVLNTTKATLNRWCLDTYGDSFSTMLKKGNSEYKTSLRRNLLKLSTRNAAAAIFLAKNELGMTDNPIPMPNGTEQQTFQRALGKAAKLWDGQEPVKQDTNAPESQEPTL